MIVTSGRSKGMVDWPMYRRRLAQNGVTHRSIDFFDRDPAVFWKGVQELSSVVSQFEPDVVHCHSGVAACAASAVRDTREEGFRLIGQLHSWGTDRPEWMNTMDIAGSFDPILLLPMPKPIAAFSSKQVYRRKR
jgi:hypothetical protein